MNKASVSVIIPYYNAFSTLKRALDSIQEQSLQVEKVFIIDDCSIESERPESIISLFLEPLNIEYVRLNENKGAANARNIGVNLAKTKYLAFLDADDVWSVNKIEIQYLYMECNNIKFSSHDYVPNITSGHFFKEEVIALQDLKSTSFIITNPVSTPTVMVIRDNFIPFDEKYRRLDDYKCWLLNVANSGGVKLRSELAAGFKPAIGHSGLTGSISAMHSAYLLVLKDLYYTGNIDFKFYLFARVVESIKYPIRFFVKLINRM